MPYILSTERTRRITKYFDKVPEVHWQAWQATGIIVPMCGRGAVVEFKGEAVKRILADRLPELTPDYNISPRGILPVLRLGKDGLPEAGLRRWGLVPSWAQDLAFGEGKHNARAETVAEKPTYRAAFRKHRVLVAVEGFYEWQERPKGEKDIPFFIHHSDPEEMLVFAGLEEHWAPKDKPDQVVRTCTIITTAPNKVMKPIHDRMPVILPVEDWDCWLDPKASLESLHQLLATREGLPIAMHQVGFEVGNSDAKGPQLMGAVA